MLTNSLRRATSASMSMRRLRRMRGSVASGADLSAWAITTMLRIPFLQQSMLMRHLFIF
jgi:hypothetical protein